MVEDTPDDLVHELFTENFWHEPSARPADSRHAGDRRVARSPTGLRQYFTGAYTAPNLIVAAVGNIEHQQVRDLVTRAFDGLPTISEPLNGGAADASCRRSSSATRSSSRATSASARAAIGRITRTATPATC